VQSMFLYLEPILKEMNAWDSSYIQSLLTSAFWGFDDILLAPVTGAEYQLYLYNSNDNDIHATVQELRTIYLKSIKDPEYDPILQHKAIDHTVYDEMKSKAAIPAKQKEEEQQEKSFIGGIRKDDLAHEQKKKKRRKIFWIIFSVLLVATSMFILLDYFGILHLIWA